MNLTSNKLKISTMIFLCSQAAFGAELSFSLPQDCTDIIFSYCSLSDVLNTRLISQRFILKNDDQYFNIYSQYNDEKKQISPTCAFLDCVYKKKYKEVEWFLKNKIHNPLFNIYYEHGRISFDNIKYFAINSLDLIAKNDLKMQKLFTTYKYNQEKFFISLREIQEQCCKDLGLGDLVLNEHLKEWQQASDIKTINEETIDLTSNNLKEKLSAKEYWHKKLVNTDCYHELILAACIGDIDCFDRLMQNCNEKTENRNIYWSIFLSIFAAVKNKDLNFIEFILQKPLCFLQKPFYFERIKSDAKGLLSAYLLNTFAEWAQELEIFNHKHFSNERIAWIKKLIEIGMFTQMPTMIDKNQCKNRQINEIYKAIKLQQINKQDIKKNKMCSIQ